MSRHDDLKKLIAEHYRHLHILKQQEAGYGSLNVPTYILIQIQDRETEIEKLQAELAIVEENEKGASPPKLAASPAVAVAITPTVATDPQMVERRAQLRVFLCHATEDKPRVKELYHHLKDVGYRPWLDKFDLLPGQKWQSAIKRSSPTSILSSWFASRIIQLPNRAWCSKRSDGRWIFWSECRKRPSI